MWMRMWREKNEEGINGALGVSMQLVAECLCVCVVDSGMLGRRGAQKGTRGQNREDEDKIKERKRRGSR